MPKKQNIIHTTEHITDKSSPKNIVIYNIFGVIKKDNNVQKEKNIHFNQEIDIDYTNGTSSRSCNITIFQKIFSMLKNCFCISSKNPIEKKHDISQDTNNPIDQNNDINLENYIINKVELDNTNQTISGALPEVFIEETSTVTA
ncbi:MAG: hypothetical protein ISN64_00975 [Rickettsia sp.]|nr:hypothetical protein [Rickettsia sp.]